LSWPYGLGEAENLKKSRHNFNVFFMKKISSFGKPLSREEMKKINGGGFINWVCTCNGTTWTSGCETIGCVQLQAPSHCGYGSSLSCTHIPQEP
jgi:hypothetical protein